IGMCELCNYNKNNMTDKQRPVAKYPNAFLFGCVTGGVLQLFTRAATVEPLCARPFSYLRVGLFFGCVISYYDYFRRYSLQEVLYAEEKQRYYSMTKAINGAVRYGEEDDIQNLTEYMAGYTTRA
ncbi:MAG: hypothetical protein ACK559_22895, partial [bacterium]